MVTMILIMINQYRSGFTVVEILIVISVIGIIAGITVVGYRGVTKRAGDTKTASNLAKAQDFIESKDLNSGLYPASLSGFTGDAGVNLTYVPSADRKTYCLSAVGTSSNAVSYKLVQEGKISEGTCVAPPFDGPDQGTYTSYTCVPGAYAPDPRPYTTISFDSDSKTVYPYFNITVYMYDASGSTIASINAPNEPNYLTAPGTFTYGLGNGYEDGVEAEIEVSYVKPDGSISNPTLSNVQNVVDYQASCSGYTE